MPYDPNIAREKGRNAEVFRETTKYIQAGFYTAPSGNRVDLDMQAMIDGGRCYHTEQPKTDAPRVEGGTTVLVERGDCLKVAERLVGEGYNPALLNFASAGHPGGGVEGGSRAQEETICRRSTLSRSIFSFDMKYSSRYGYPLQPGDGYPISRSLNYSAVYSPRVTVFREAGPEYTLMEHPFQVGVITNAALNLNGRFDIHLTPDGHIPEDGKVITLNKIRTIFRIGLHNGHDSLVLGAFGCGAFHNPPREMAQLFRTVMEEDEFKDRFRLITFAILSDHNDRSGNYDAFREVFGGSDPELPEDEDSMVFHEKGELFLINGRWCFTNNCYGMGPDEVFGTPTRSVVTDAYANYGLYFDDFCYDVTMCRVNGKWGLLLKTGFEGMGCANYQSNDENTFVYDDFLFLLGGDKWNDQKGPQTAEFYSTIRGYIAVKQNGKWGILKIFKTAFVPVQYTELIPCTHRSLAEAVLFIPDLTEKEKLKVARKI